jgi:hypothetical protein
MQAWTCGSFIAAALALVAGSTAFAERGKPSGGVAGNECGCVGDINGNAEVDGADLGILLSDWGTVDPDSNLDGLGSVDGADLGLLLANWGPCAAVPPNDECSNAEIIFEGGTPFCTSSATSSGPAACTDGALSAEIFKDIWYRYVAVDDGTLTISTCGAANFDTKIAVYGSILPTVCACPGGLGFSTLLACDDDTNGCGQTTELSMEVNAGECYHIRLGGYPNFSGTGVLTLDFDPSGEYCNSCIEISGFDNDVEFEGTTAGNNISFVDSSCGLNDIFDEWYCYEVSCSGAVTIDTFGSELDTVLAVYKGTCDTQPPPLEELGCSDDYDFNEDGGIDPPAERASQVFIDSNEINFGDTLYIRIAGYNGTTGAYKLRIQCSNCCGPHSSAGCFPSECSNCVCDKDPFCCSNLWDGVCAATADNECDEACPCDN